jgi:hypothetical protein
MSFIRSLSCFENVFRNDYCASGFNQSKGGWNPSGNRGKTGRQPCVRVIPP